jgi:hypothetical protein
VDLNERCQQKDKKKPQPLFQQAQIVARSSEDGIDCIAFRSFQVISFQMAASFIGSMTGSIAFRLRISRLASHVWHLTFDCR